MSRADPKAEAAVRRTVEDLLALHAAGEGARLPGGGPGADLLVPGLLVWWAEALERLRLAAAPAVRPPRRPGLMERVGFEAVLASGRVPEVVRREALAAATGVTVPSSGSDRERIVGLGADWIEFLTAASARSGPPLRVAHAYYGAIEATGWARLAAAVVRDLRSRAGV